MTVAQWIPIVVPELGGEPVQVVQWLVEPGTSLVAGDRLLELLTAGVLFHLSADADGVLVQQDCTRGCLVNAGETLGWIEPPESEFSP